MSRFSIIQSAGKTQPTVLLHSGATRSATTTQPQGSLRFRTTQPAPKTQPTAPLRLIVTQAATGILQWALPPVTASPRAILISTSAAPVLPAKPTPSDSEQQEYRTPLTLQVLQE